MMSFVDGASDNYDADADHNSNGDDMLQLHQHSKPFS